MRRTIDQIRKVLAFFGVSDPGDIADLFKRKSRTTINDLEKVLKGLDLKLPSNVATKFVARSLLNAAFADDPLTLRWRDSFGKAPNLVTIKTGAKQASKYHRTIFGTLNGIFDGSLVNGRIEQEINTGIHRVDIMYENSANVGFFRGVKSRLSLKSDHVPVECKNYSDDVGSPEYDQLGGRLNDKDRQVGVLVVRNIVDKRKAFEHLKAKWAKRELIILLDDDEILAMHKARYDGETNLINERLWSKVHSLQLNSIK